MQGPTDSYGRESLALARPVREYLAQGGRAPDRSVQPPRFRRATFAYWGAFAASVAAAAAMGGGIAVLGGLAGFVLFFVAAAALFHDLRVPDPRDRSTPERAVRCWSRALRYGHFRKAYSCHHPDLLPDSLEVGAMPTIMVPGARHSLTEFGGFRTMWKSIVGSSGGTNRVVRRELVGEIVVQGDVAEGEVLLEVVSYGSWVYLGLLLGLIPMFLLYLLTRRVVTLTVPLQLFRHGDQWWVVPPVPEETLQRRPAERLPRATLR